MPRYRVDKGPYDKPPKTLVFYEDDGNRIRRYKYVCPVRCIDCKRSEVTKADGALRLVCPERSGFLQSDGYCDRGER